MRSALIRVQTTNGGYDKLRTLWDNPAIQGAEHIDGPVHGLGNPSTYRIYGDIASLIAQGLIRPLWPSARSFDLA